MHAADSSFPSGRWELLPLDVDIRLTGAGAFPAFKGVLLRGAFGTHFRATVCTTGMRTCEGCRLLSSCAFPYVFDTAAEPSVASAPPALPALRAHRTHAPHPFAIQAPDDAAASAPADTRWRFRFTLVGQARALLPYFVHAFLRMQQAGLGPDRVPFQVLGIDAALPQGPWEVYRPGASALRYPPQGDSWPAPLQTDALEVRLRTLTRVKSAGRIQSELPFRTLVRAALRRVSALHVLYCGGAPAPQIDDLLALADQVATVDSDLRPARIERYSTRTHEVMAFDGVVGRVRYRGPLAAWTPWLRAAAAVNIGKGGTFGFGVFDLQAVA
ncbi:MAG: CRISPR system precrRNA processing endoribonuclease RAMP protein Cas6 [Planctomycetes bacterium]|nr:CRISPR system precrRNA processing endoribonuclease RAMP protein Cas6 [Planctomycetota bacterium]